VVYIEVAVPGTWVGHTILELRVQVNLHVSKVYDVAVVGVVIAAVVIAAGVVAGVVAAVDVGAVEAGTRTGA